MAAAPIPPGETPSVPYELEYRRWDCFYATPIQWGVCLKCGKREQWCQVHNRVHCGCQETDTVRLPR